MNVIVIKCTDGSVQIMQLIEAKDAAAEVEKWKAANAGLYASHREMPIEAVPADRTFRGAWTDASPELVIDIDMTKARGIHRDRIRAVRAPMLAALDIDYQRADEVGDTAAKQKVAAKKQALRDATINPAIEAAATPEALAALPVPL